MLDKIAEELFSEVRKEKESNENGLSDSLLSALNCIFGQSLVYALDLVDKKSVTKYTCPSGRSTFKVVGSSGDVYTCLLNSNYCTCPSYVYTVLVKRDVLMCKHVLAMHLSVALDACTAREISDSDMESLLTESLA
ncbi:zinc finger SWIM domain-containing protein 7-like [Oscarella lobularis]|uniref:zinc finger SWIM domain-containing protein 7-like n=1 Tax=Oscarella lobularis TaxID=121494 RepID=UPI00331429D5